LTRDVWENYAWSPVNSCFEALCWFTALLITCAPAARADVGIALADPTHVGASEWTQAGHSSVYLSGVCAETPTKLRLCEPGEQGSILTTFPDFDERSPYEWNAVPLSLYLYGSTDADAMPLYASPALKRAQESAAAQQVLQQVCAGACPDLPHAYWRDLINATMSRDIYVFTMRTTREQDEDFVRRVNNLPNLNRYRLATHNCANFARDMVNLYFPHSVHRDILNDLGMMGPKSAARSFTHYAERRPELGLYVFHFTQQPGIARRCGTARAGTETAFHEPKYLLPAALIGDHEVAGSFFVAYFLTGRFGLQHTYEQFAATQHHPHPDAAVVGTSKQWRQYRERFDGEVNDAVHDGTLRTIKELRHVFALLDRETIPAIDPQGHPWLVWHAGTREERRAGVDWSNVRAPESDTVLAHLVLLARMDAELRSPPKGRPPLPVFARECELLGELERETRAANAMAARAVPLRP
jgi:hypothetical protein